MLFPEGFEIFVVRGSFMSGLMPQPVTHIRHHNHRIRKHLGYALVQTVCAVESLVKGQESFVALVKLLEPVAAHG